VSKQKTIHDLDFTTAAPRCGAAPARGKRIWVSRRIDAADVNCEECLRELRRPSPLKSLDAYIRKESQS
jgi:hypothetical protein